MSRVLVTGASGLLGRTVAQALTARGDAVTVMQRRPADLDCRQMNGDITDADAVAAAVHGQDAIVHLAAKVDVVGRWEDYRRVNVEGTATLLGAARQAGVGRFVHISSPSVAHAGRALVGVGAAPADPASARGHYARSKARAEQLALAANGPDLAVLALRPHLVWGPGDTQLIARIVARARTGRLALIDEGAALIDTTYVTNAADAIVAALDRCRDVSGETFVVSNGEPRPVADIVAAVCASAGVLRRPPRVRYPVAWGAGAVVDGVWALRQRLGPRFGVVGEPPLTRFLVEQLATAHWFAQARTRSALRWIPQVGLDEGFAALARSYGTESA